VIKNTNDVPRRIVTTGNVGDLNYNTNNSVYKEGDKHYYEADGKTYEVGNNGYLTEVMPTGLTEDDPYELDAGWLSEIDAEDIQAAAEATGHDFAADGPLYVKVKGIEEPFKIEKTVNGTDSYVIKNTNDVPRRVVTTDEDGIAGLTHAGAENNAIYKEGDKHYYEADGKTYEVGNNGYLTDMGDGWSNNLDLAGTEKYDDRSGINELDEISTALGLGNGDSLSDLDNAGKVELAHIIYALSVGAGAEDYTALNQPTEEEIIAYINDLDGTKTLQQWFDSVDYNSTSHITSQTMNPQEMSYAVNGKASIDYHSRTIDTITQGDLILAESRGNIEWAGEFTGGDNDGNKYGTIELSGAVYGLRYNASLDQYEYFDPETGEYELVGGFILSAFNTAAGGAEDASANSQALDATEFADNITAGLSSPYDEGEVTTILENLGVESVISGDISAYLIEQFGDSNGEINSTGLFQILANINNYGGGAGGTDGAIRSSDIADLITHYENDTDISAVYGSIDLSSAIFNNVGTYHSGSDSYKLYYEDMRDAIGLSTTSDPIGDTPISEDNVETFLIALGIDVYAASQIAGNIISDLGGGSATLEDLARAAHPDGDSYGVGESDWETYISSMMYSMP